MSVTKVDLHLSQKISSAREAGGLTLQEAADRLDISVEELVLLETGNARVDASMVSQLAMALDKPIAWFFDQEPKAVQFPSGRKHF